MWTPIKSGYVLRTPFRVYFYSHELTLTHSVKVGESSSLGVRDLVIADDTLLYLLESGYIDQYDLRGELLHRWRYPSHRIWGQNLAINNTKLIIGGHKYWFASPKIIPEFLLYDLKAADDPITFTEFYPDSLLESLEEDVDKLLSVSVASFKDGFVVVGNASPQVFIFSHSGQLQEEINDTPPGYKGIFDAPRFDFQRAVRDRIYTKEWNDSWDYTAGWSRIRVIDDSLLIVPRRINRPYYVDIYNLRRKHFVQRLQSDAPLIGASNGRLFFADSLGESFLKISTYQIVAEGSSFGEPPDSVVEDHGCSLCGRELSRYKYVETPKEKINEVDTIGAGEDRLAFVLGNRSFEPDSLLRFCLSDKKNMFVFISPDGIGGDGVLIDSLSQCLEGKPNWMLTTIVCYSKPEELTLYLLDLPGDQILINQNVAIPDSTMALSDLGLPPIVLAFNEGGKRFIAGYSLAPNYDPGKKQKGITFEEFLKECGIIEQ